MAFDLRPTYSSYQFIVMEAVIWVGTFKSHRAGFSPIYQARDNLSLQQRKATTFSHSHGSMFWKSIANKIIRTTWDSFLHPAPLLGQKLQTENTSVPVPSLIVHRFHTRRVNLRGVEANALDQQRYRQISTHPSPE